MKILLVASLAESLLNFRGSLITALGQHGLSVHVAAPQMTADSKIRHALEERGVSVHDIAMSRTGMSVVGDFKTMLALCGLMHRIQPDLVLSYTIKPVVYGTLAAWLNAVPRRFVLMTGLGYAFTGRVAGIRSVVKAIAKFLYRLSLRFAHKVFFQNADDQALFFALGLLPRGTLSVVVNGSGIDLDQFTVTPLPEGCTRFLLIARLLGDKGVREYAIAAQSVRRKHPDAVFYLVGWIDENPDAIKKVELDGWVEDGRLVFLGRMEDVRPAIAASSVYVLPSYREGMPRTVLEAMAMGRPIITTNAPGCRETVEEGQNGILVPIMDAGMLAQAMERFIDEPSLVGSMGAHSRRIAEEKYDVKKVNWVMLREMGIK